MISGVLEEILWAIQEMSENEGTVSMDKNKNVHGLPFINTVSDFKVEGNIVLKDILKVCLLFICLKFYYFSFEFYLLNTCF